MQRSLPHPPCAWHNPSAPWCHWSAACITPFGGNLTCAFYIDPKEQLPLRALPGSMNQLSNFPEALLGLAVQAYLLETPSPGQTGTVGHSTPREAEELDISTGATRWAYSLLYRGAGSAPSLACQPGELTGHKPWQIGQKALLSLIMS